MNTTNPAPPPPKSLPTPLPQRLGRLFIEPGVYGDYRALAHLHYRPGHPQCPVAVLRARHAPPGRASRPRTVGVLVTCYPSLRCEPRERHLGLAGDASADFAPWVNANLRVLRRVIVHPQFRGLGLATALIRAALADAPTRYTESIAVMGSLVPMFERAGMTRVPTAAGAPAYFIHDGGAR